MTWPSDDTMDIDHELIIDVPNGDHNYHADIHAFNYTREAGNQMRDNIAHHMWEQYVSHKR